ncbi:glycosyltransferase family 4 protein [Methanolobus sp. WCC5]|uniref:glycosyltransferase family 4 protein n=1 Tax=Methanolobus sp. WCC5 TaxID=3125785 RepID=UPI0032480678
MKKKHKILVVYNHKSTFVAKDIKILSDFFDVKEFEYRKKSDYPRLVWDILWSDVNYSWFALGYATAAVIISKILRKKSIVVAGGWDVEYFPDLNYGAMQSPGRIRKTCFTLKHADKILAVSESTKKSVLRWCKDSNVETVYHGYDHRIYFPLQKDSLVVSIGTSSWGTLNVKGIETFVKSASYLPDVTFMLIGPHSDESILYLKEIASPNVIFKNYTPHNELIPILGKAKVYVQASAQESFGSALAEAMLCECVPVVTVRGALPEVVGNSGYYVEYNDPERTAQQIKKALMSNKGSIARDRIIRHFPIDTRRNKIIEIIKNNIDEQNFPLA